MKRRTFVLAMIAGVACLACAVNTLAAAPVLFEEAYAREEEKRIIAAPIAGIQNSLWFDYRIDVMQAQKELSSDLRRANDTEDRRDAWEELLLTRLKLFRQKCVTSFVTCPKRSTAS